MQNSPPTVSFEFFPPKDEVGEKQLWTAIESLREFNPDFVSVTYGAGGSTRERTISIACDIFSRTGFRTIAHLTCVGSTRAELSAILQQYASAGINDILALRGDPVGGPSAPWTPTPDGLNHADELVALAAVQGNFTIGVAAFPDVHPASQGNFEQDLEVLLAKERAGATFAITQFFFDSSHYARLVDALDTRGSQLAIYPGIMPVTNVKQIGRMLELSGGHMPAHLGERFEATSDNSQETQRLGIEVATLMCDDAHRYGADGFHFYTLNSSGATREVLRNISHLVHPPQ